MTSVIDHTSPASPSKTWPGRALNWWLDELREAYDDLARWLGLGGRRSITIEAGERYWVLRQWQQPIGQIDWQGGDPDACRLALLGSLPGDGTSVPVFVEIPPDRVLSKTVAFPAEARAQLARIIEFEIGRHFPFPAERVHFRYRVLAPTAKEPSAQTISVEIAVVPKDLVAGICRELSLAGLVPSGIALVTERGADPMALPMNSIGAVGKPSANIKNRLPLAGLAALAVIAAISWPLAQQVRLTAIERELAELKPKADAAIHERDRQQRAAERAASVSMLTAGRPPLVQIVDTLSRDIPDGSWLLSLSVSGRDIVLDGLSPSAATIVQALERSRQFSTIDFRSPINRDPATGLEHFQIGATLPEPKS